MKRVPLRGGDGFYSHAKVMRKVFLFALFLFGSVLGVLAQPNEIRSMSWGKDYKLHIGMSDDSTYVVDIKGLFHQPNGLESASGAAKTTYLPVAFDPEFVRYLKSKPALVNAEDSVSYRKASNTTLWSALHAYIGGGYVHLINSLIYALEAGSVKLQSPLMLRPRTEWRPSPMTETYKRTRKWSYYVPTGQKEARREYKLRKKEGDLQDLVGIPQRFIDLFLETSDSDYRRLARDGEKEKIAQIDLVRLLLGAKYLGATQIGFISDGVRQAVGRYTASNLPSVILFDDFDAAVAMQLDSAGYRIDYIVFQNQQAIPAAEVARRKARINAIVDNINEANRMIFRQRLQSYYQK